MEEKELESLTKKFTGKNPPNSDPEELRSWFRSCDDIAIAEFHVLLNRKIYSSTTPFEKLRRISITDMRIIIPAKDGYLLLRCLEEPKYPSAIFTIVEDHSGNVFMLAAYNMISCFSKEVCQEFFSIGTTFILKEPLLKPVLKGKFLIHCDSPSDIIFLKKYHKWYSILEGIEWKNMVNHEEILPTDSDSLEQLGHEAFKVMRYRLALDYYLLSLHVFPGNDASFLKLLFLNIADTYLLLSCFEDTLRFTDKVFQIDALDVKALFISGRAHYELRQFNEAKYCFSKLLVVDAKNSGGLLYMSKTMDRLQELEGNVDLKEYFKKYLENPNDPLDCADFIGSLEMKEMPDGEKKILASQDIKAGTLLLVSKAICGSLRANESNLTGQDKSEINYLYDSSLIQEIALLVMKNPKTFGCKVYDFPIGDSFTNSTKPALYCDIDTLEEPIADIDRIGKIVIRCAYNINNHRHVHIEGKARISGTNLFLFPSYLKFSCIGNAFSTCLNNILLIHATRNIKVGEEITIWHSASDISYKDAVFNLTEIKCDCRLCELDGKESEETLKRRESLCKKIGDIYKQMADGNKEFKNDKYLEVATKIVLDIEESYRKSRRTELKCWLVKPYLYLALIHTLKNSFSPKILKSIMKSISSSGFDPNTLAKFALGRQFVDIPINAWLSQDTLTGILMLAELHSLRGKTREVKKWLKVLFVVENMMTGIDINIFTRKYENRIEGISNILTD